MKSLFLGFIILSLTACGGGGGGSSSGPVPPVATTYDHVLEGEDFPEDLESSCPTCATIGTWTLSWNEDNGNLTGVFKGPWGEIPVSGTVVAGVYNLVATPASPMPPSGVDEIRFTVPAIYADSEEDDILPINIQVMAGGADITGPVSAVYPKIKKKASGEVEVEDDTPPVQLTDFNLVKGKYEGTVVELTNKIFPTNSVSAENPRGWNHGNWTGKKYCDIQEAESFAFFYVSAFSYQTQFSGSQFPGGLSLSQNGGLEAGSTPSSFVLKGIPGYPSSTLGSKDGFLISNAHSPEVNFEVVGSFTEVNGTMELSAVLKITYKYAATGGQDPMPAFEEEACSYQLDLERTIAYP